MDRIDSQSEMTTEAVMENGSLDRRSALKQMMMGAIGVAASSTLVGCLGEGIPTSSALSNPSSNNGTAGSGEQGSFENPFTQDDYGTYSAGAALRNAVVFGSLVSDDSATTPITRLWVEVMDESTLINDRTVGDVLGTESLHPSTASEYVSQIKLIDSAGNEVASVSLKAGDAPRMIVERDLTGISTLTAYAYIEASGGWWKGTTYNTSDLSVAAPTTGDGNYGSFRKALCTNQAGVYKTNGGKKAKHAGRWNMVTGGKARMLFSGNSSGDKYHDDWTASHYVTGGYLLDQNGQPLKGVTYKWTTTGSDLTTDENGFVAKQDTGAGADITTGSPAPQTTESFLTVTLPAGVTQIRFVWLCSTDGWWDSRYDISGNFSWPVAATAKNSA